MVSLLRNDLQEAICFELDSIAERINETLEEVPESTSELVLVDSIQLTNELEWKVNLSINGSPLTIYVDYETTSYEGIEEVALEICLKLLGTIKMEAAAYD